MQKSFFEKFQRNACISHWNSARQKSRSSKVNRVSMRRRTVFMNGGQEFMDVDPLSWTVGPNSQQVVAAFFDRLLRKHGVI